jgi:hypothetical protein
MRQIIMYPGEDGFWVVECPSLRGCISQGANASHHRGRSPQYDSTRNYQELGRSAMFANSISTVTSWKTVRIERWHSGSRISS